MTTIAAKSEIPGIWPGINNEADRAVDVHDENDREADAAYPFTNNERTRLWLTNAITFLGSNSCHKLQPADQYSMFSASRTSLSVDLR